MNLTADLRSALRRQATHWRLAAERLGRSEEVAPASGWQSLEARTGVALRTALQRSVERLRALAVATEEAASDAPFERVQAAVLELRSSFGRTETLMDFFADAIASRATPQTARLLATLDRLAEDSMRPVLDRMGIPTPPVVTFVDKGLGAAILKAGLRLWDRTTDNPVAAIKVVRHNLLRPTSVLHEAGHQVAYAVGWNDELAQRLQTTLPRSIADTWASWASEIAADAYAFVHAGYAAVAALHDVVDGGPSMVYRFVPYDPHPVAHLRVLLGAQMCRLAYRTGPWDNLARAWLARYPVESAPSDIRDLLAASLPALPHVAETTLTHRYRAFSGPLVDTIDPQRVAPRELQGLRVGFAGRTSTATSIRRELIRLVALSGYDFAAASGGRAYVMTSQMRWMLRLGQHLAA